MPSKVEQLVTEFLEHLEIEKGRAQNTLRNYDFYLHRFVDWSGVTTPAGITQDVVRQYRLWLNRALPGREEATMKKNTQNFHLVALRNFLKYLARRDIKTLAPEKIELAKFDARHVEFLEADELERILAVPLDVGRRRKDRRTRERIYSLVQLRDKAILELLFSTGLRVAELSGLTIEQINLKRDEFTVKGKGGKRRVVFLTDEAKRCVKAYLDKRTDLSPYLFVSHDAAGDAREDSGPLTPRSIQRLVEKCAKAAGITKRITPHVLRHTYATTLLRNGADIRSVQAMLGHSSITTTQIYTHVTDKTLREVHKKFHRK